MKTKKKSQKPARCAVDVIVPVYRDLEVTRRCIESVLAAEKGARANLIVIDDATPEPALRSYCQSLAEMDGVTVLVNAENKGFVATVNRGMRENPAHDVILLNSDTEVSGDWQLRMEECAYRESHTGTVTPFSNNGTICSYPRILKSNKLPKGYDVAQMQSLFARVHHAKQHIIPTGVGFCLYIRRSCLDEVGYFDEANFGRGYGEECDFSMRAAASGWENQLAADVFIYHEGGVSFSSETEERIQAAEVMMTKKHPSYNGKVMNFIAKDPLAIYRDAIDDALLSESSLSEQYVLDASRDYRNDLLKGVAALQKQEHQYAELLASVRAEYSRTDAGLSEAQQLVKKYLTALDERDAALAEQANLLTNVREEFSRTDAGLLEAQQLVKKYLIALSERDRWIEEKSLALEEKSLALEEKGLAYQKLLTEINSIKNSRTWRYSQWIRDLLKKP